MILELVPVCNGVLKGWLSRLRCSLQCQGVRHSRIVCVLQQLQSAVQRHVWCCGCFVLGDPKQFLSWKQMSRCRNDTCWCYSARWCPCRTSSRWLRLELLEWSGSFLRLLSFWITGFSLMLGAEDDWWAFEVETGAVGVEDLPFEVVTSGSTFGGGWAGGVRTVGRMGEAIGLAVDDEDESSYWGASWCVTVGVKVIGAMIGLRCDRWWRRRRFLGGSDCERRSCEVASIGCGENLSALSLDETGEVGGRCGDRCGRGGRVW